MEERLITYLIAIPGTALLLGFWVIVQGYWKQTFSDEITDDDVLAGRNSCGSCGCGTVCQNKTKKNLKTY